MGDGDATRSTRHLVPTDTGLVHVRDSGPADAPTLLFLHETPTNSTAWDLVTGPLSRSWRVLAPDTPGYGASDPLPAGPVTAEAYAHTFGQLLDHLGIDRVVVVGVHTGALFGVHLAAGPWADRVAGLVLTGVPVYSEEERLQKAAVTRDVPPPVEDGGHLMHVWNHVGGHTKPLVHRTRLTCQVLLADQPYRAYEAVFGADLRPALARVTASVLLLTVADDSLARTETEVAAMLPSVRIHRLEGTAPAYRTAPDAYAAAVHDAARGWLA